MRLGRHTNRWTGEVLMQEAMCMYLTGLGLTFKEEVHVRKVKRRADFLVIRKNGLINIEAKCNNYLEMLNQLDDHAKYCNYCFAYITNVGMTPEWFKKELMERKYGLIVYDIHNRVCTEVIEAHQNQIKKEKLRKKVLSNIRLDNINEDRIVC